MSQTYRTNAFLVFSEVLFAFSVKGTRARMQRLSFTITWKS